MALLEFPYAGSAALLLAIANPAEPWTVTGFSTPEQIVRSSETIVRASALDYARPQSDPTIRTIGMPWLVWVRDQASRAVGPKREPRARKDERTLAELQQALATAWVSGDRSTIERIIAPDWKSTAPDGAMMQRAAVLADVFDTRRHKITRLDIDDVNVRVFGDAAVVTGRTHGVGTFDGSAYDVVIRFTDTFVRRDGRWQAVASHASLLAGR